MSVNLLPHATEADLKKVDSNIKGFVGIILWFGVLIVIFVILFFTRGIETGTEKELESQRAVIINKINSISKMQDEYYSLAYKTMVLEQVKTQQYRPTIIGHYVDSKISKDMTISGYSFDAAGVLLLQIESPSYLEAVKTWDSLLEDKTIIKTLELSSFSEDAMTAHVSFHLKGELNLTELYKQNAK